MSTSSSERCTRISPSAVLDDRLHGKDLEWARDHLLRCESCRERVEEFREMMMRVGRLPSAPISSSAMDEAFAASVPDRYRSGSGARLAPLYDLPSSGGIDAMPVPVPVPVPLPEPILDVPPQPVRPEVTDAPDLMSVLEREIFRDEPAQDHPTAMETPPIEPVVAAAPLVPAVPELRQVPLDSRQEPPVTTPGLFDLAAVEAAPEPALTQTEPDVAEAAPVEAEVARAALVEPQHAQPAPFEQPVEPPDEAPAPPAAGSSRRPDNVMRLAVGLGAAACVLLAAFLYEGGLLTRPAHKTSATTPSHSASVSKSPVPVASTAPSASPSAPPSAAPVLFRLGNGVAGGTVYRIRPGTAVAGYTRLVFDIRGRGLPTMAIAQPDSGHVTITFSDTGGAAVPVRGIRSFQVAAVEPAVQQGPDLVITVDLARTGRITAFTLPAAGAYSPRLVVDLHTN